MTDVTSANAILFVDDDSSSEPSATLNNLARFSDSEATTGHLRFRETAMLRKIRHLPPDLQAKHSVQLESLVEESKKRRNEEFVTAIAEVANESFARFWDNPEDAEYDAL
jgi:hypothetical protein